MCNSPAMASGGYEAVKSLPCNEIAASRAASCEGQLSVDANHCSVVDARRQIQHH